MFHLQLKVYFIFAILIDKIHSVPFTPGEFNILNNILNASGCYESNFCKFKNITMSYDCQRLNSDIVCDKNGLILQLNIANSMLSGTISSEIYNLIKLEHLYLNDNQLHGTLPTEFGFSVKLQTLNLKNN